MPSRLRLRRPDRQLPFSASCFTNPLHNQESLVQHAASLPTKVFHSTCGRFPRFSPCATPWTLHVFNLAPELRTVTPPSPERFQRHKTVGRAHPTNAISNRNEAEHASSTTAYQRETQKQSKVTPFPPPLHLLQHNVLFLMPLFSSADARKRSYAILNRTTV